MFGKKNKIKPVSYDKENWKPVLKCSICNGEQVAGFLNVHSGEFREECLIREEAELWMFRNKYGIDCEIEKVY